MKASEYATITKSAQPVPISYDETMNLMEKWQADIDLFLDETGEVSEYDARAVLHWLGLPESAHD